MKLTIIISQLYCGCKYIYGYENCCCGSRCHCLYMMYMNVYLTIKMYHTITATEASYWKLCIKSFIYLYITMYMYFIYLFVHVCTKHLQSCYLFVFFRSVTDPRDGKRVALKKMPSVFQNLVSSKRVFRELRMLCHFKHDNVSLHVFYTCVTCLLAYHVFII